MSDLWDRLRAAKARSAPRKPEPEAPSVPEAMPEPAPAGWRWVSPLTAHRCLEFPLDSGFWDLVGPGLNPAAWEDVLCFDTETTGLSGGAGTVAFLVGWASLIDTGGVPQVRIDQYFLRDHPGEESLIAALDAEFRRARALVSFNGASFDLPLLRSRWALRGREFPVRPHRDDLHPSRRLWKNVVDSCRLSRLEALVLGIHRRDDVPGALVPELWYDYLRSGADPDFAAPLDGVLRHHAQDVYSLLCLDLLLHSLRADPPSQRWSPRFQPWRTASGLARVADGGLIHPSPDLPVPVGFWGWLKLLDDSDRGAALEAYWDGKDTAVGMELAAWHKSRMNPQAMNLWTALWMEQSHWPALIEALKWMEHRDRTAAALDQALSWITEALERPFWPTSWRNELFKRQERLLQRRVRQQAD